MAELTVSPPLPDNSQLCGGVGFYNPFVGTLPVNPEWAIDQVGTGSFFTCQTEAGGVVSGYSRFNGDEIEQFSLTDDSDVEIQFESRIDLSKPILDTLPFQGSAEDGRIFSTSTITFDVPTCLLNGVTSIGPTATDCSVCAESGLTSDLSGVYNLPFQVQTVDSVDPVCILSDNCGEFERFFSGEVIN